MFSFRSHHFAFSIDGGSQNLVLAGGSETESQNWIRHIRDLLWPRSTPSSGGWAKQGKEMFCYLIHEADPQSLPVVITLFTHVVRPSPLLKFEQNQKYSLLAGLELAEWIMSCVRYVIYYLP